MSGKDPRLDKAKQLDLRDIIPVEGGHRSGNYVHGYCPFHEQGGSQARHKSPSFMVYPQRYSCLSTNCGKSGDIINWYAYKMFGDPEISLRDGRFSRILDAILGANSQLKRQGGQQSHHIYTPEKPPAKNTVKIAEITTLVETCHKLLLRTPKRLTYFYSRGFDIKTIKRQQWGWDGRRWVIPVWHAIPGKSRLVSVRFRASRPDDLRYSGVGDFNDRTLYNREALLYAKKHCTPLVVMYGEFDAQLSWQHGIPTVSPTNGAKSFQLDWLEGFTGDVIYVPDRKEERDAYADAEGLDARGWVVQLPIGPYKDYTELWQSGKDPAVLWREVYRATHLGFFRQFVEGARQ